MFYLLNPRQSSDIEKKYEMTRSYHETYDYTMGSATVTELRNNVKITCEMLHLSICIFSVPYAKE